MKTFKQAITENKAGDEILDLRLGLIDWWKKHANQPTLKAQKKDLEKLYNQLLTNLDQVVDMVYESEPEA